MNLWRKIKRLFGRKPKVKQLGVIDEIVKASLKDIGRKTTLSQTVDRQCGKKLADEIPSGKTIKVRVPNRFAVIDSTSPTEDEVLP